MKTTPRGALETSASVPILKLAMTTNERIHELSFCYDADLPPSVPAGKPLRSSRACQSKSRLRRGLRRLGRLGGPRPRS
jgi:hypothetical protein